MPAQEQFSFRLSADIKELLETLYDKIGGHKFRIIESAIETFDALPKKHQLTMISQDDEERNKVLALIRKLDGTDGGRKRT